MLTTEKIIFLDPVFKETIWGGDKIGKKFSYGVPKGNIGEAWLVSAHENGDCIIKNGQYKGQNLSGIWKNHKELFGNMQGDTFPLLAKIIDAKDDLSIQVHPNDDYAYKHENGSLGKTECWYILDCEEDSTIILGHNAKDKEMLKEMINNNEWKNLIREVPIKKGDFFQIEPGTVHAIKGGILLLEIQQSSDITYRLYDYGRLSDDKPRQLHIDKSVDVITYSTDYSAVERKITNLDNARIEDLIISKYYKVRKLDIWNEIDIQQSELFTIVNVIDGNGEIDGLAIHKGDNFILPHGYNEYTLSGELTLIQSSPVVE